MILVSLLPALLPLPSLMLDFSVSASAFAIHILYITCALKLSPHVHCCNTKPRNKFPRFRCLTKRPSCSMADILLHRSLHPCTCCLFMPSHLSRQDYNDPYFCWLFIRPLLLQSWMYSETMTHKTKTLFAASLSVAERVYCKYEPVFQKMMHI